MVIYHYMYSVCSSNSGSLSKFLKNSALLYYRRGCLLQEFLKNSDGRNQLPLEIFSILQELFRENVAYQKSTLLLYSIFSIFQLFRSEFCPRSSWQQNSSRILVGIPFHSLKQLALFSFLICNSFFYQFQENS